MLTVRKRRSHCGTFILYLVNLNIQKDRHAVNATLRDNQKRNTISFSTDLNVYMKCPGPWPCEEMHWLRLLPTSGGTRWSRKNVGLLHKASEVLGS